MEANKAVSTAFCTSFRFAGTNVFFSSALKNLPPAAGFFSSCFAKNSSEIPPTLTEATSNLVDVAMTYAWLNRRNGTPLISNGPETNNRPDGNCFKNTARLPRNRPAKMITTVPGVKDGLNLVERTWGRRCCKGVQISSAEYHLGSRLAWEGVAVFDSCFFSSNCFFPAAPLAANFHPAVFLNAATRPNLGTPRI